MNPFTTPALIALAASLSGCASLAPMAGWELLKTGRLDGDVPCRHPSRSTPSTTRRRTSTDCLR